MEVTISVGTKFHAFHLAYQLQKRESLQKIITGYPQFRLQNEKVKKSKIESISWPLLVRELFKRSPLPYNPLSSYQYAELFDKLARKRIEPTDIFVGWSGNSLHSLRKAKKLGATTVLERGSSHISYQNEILKEEFEKFGIEKEPVDPRIQEKELKEYKEADYIAVPSQFVVDSFIEQGVSKEKLIKIPYGVDLENFKEVPKKDDTFRIIFVGGIGFQKGVYYLLKAFEELDIPNSELVLIGRLSDQEFQPILERYCDDDNNCKYKGVVNHKELYKDYSNASVLVHPSIQEGLAMAQLEAMACGLPVICTTNTGGEEVIEEGKEGFIVPIRDVGALKEKILFCYNNREKCKQMGQAAKKKVRESFTWDDYGEKVIQEYNKILTL